MVEGIRGRPTTRRDEAITRVNLVIEDLRKARVEAKIIGSLATGRFGPHSDVDLLVVKCPRDLKYTIEGIVEDRLQDISFDVVYLDEIPDHRREALLTEAMDANHLR